jgi:hypothetical protein
LPAPAQKENIYKIHQAKIAKDFSRFLLSTRMYKVMWWGETEAQFEEAMNDHTMKLARQEQKELVRSLMLSLKAM